MFNQDHLQEENAKILNNLTSSNLLQQIRHIILLSDKIIHLVLNNCFSDKLIF